MSVVVVPQNAGVKAPSVHQGRNVLYFLARQAGNQIRYALVVVLEVALPYKAGANLVSVVLKEDLPQNWVEVSQWLSSENLSPIFSRKLLGRKSFISWIIYSKSINARISTTKKYGAANTNSQERIFFLIRFFVSCGGTSLGWLLLPGSPKVRDTTPFFGLVRDI